MDRLIERAVQLIVLIVGIGLITLISAWPVMMGAGIANSYWPAIPAVSYWDAFWLTWAIGTLVGRIGRIDGTD